MVLAMPAARLVARGEERLLLLAEVEEVLASRSLVVDACRGVVRTAGAAVSLERRPVLLALARALGEAWPRDVQRETLLMRAFRARHADESHRARLRVEIGRLRAELRGMAGVTATERGFRLLPRRADQVVVLVPPVEDAHAVVLALLADGEAWSSSGAGTGARDQPAQRAGGAGVARRGRKGPVGRSRTGAALDGPAGSGVPDSDVTPDVRPRAVGWRHEAIGGRSPAGIRALSGHRQRGRGDPRRNPGLVRIRRPAECA